MRTASISKFLRFFLDFLIPLRCIKCGIVTEKMEGLCPSCWSTIPFISKPFCACCGLPFEFEIEEGALCALCSHNPPFYTKARSVFAYTPESRDLVLKLKHLDGLNVVPLFAQWMAQRAEEKGEVICIPVPLHWTRLFMRTYNQAALLAQEVSGLKGWMYAPHLLLRKRRTPSQGYLSKKERIKNVEGAFCVPPSKKRALANKTIVLVDDVLTTGATLTICSKVLLKAGANQVHALTLARVIKADPLT